MRNSQGTLRGTRFASLPHQNSLLWAAPELDDILTKKVCNLLSNAQWKRPFISALPRLETSAWTKPIPLHRAVLGCAVVYLICLLPLFIVEIPPLQDYHFHVARIYILNHWHDTPALQKYYKITSFLLPNVGMDVIALLFAKLMPLEAAGKAFISLTLGLQLTGCMALYRSVHGHYGLWPLVAGIFLFNWIFIFGFLNYLFGVGLLMWAVAIWISLGSSVIWLRISLGSALSTCLFFCHMVTVGLFAVIVGAYEIQRSAGMVQELPKMAFRNLATGASIFLPPICLFLISATADEAHETISYTSFLWKPAIFVRALLSANWIADAATVVIVAAFLTILFLRGRLTLARPMRLPIALLIITFLAMPHVLFSAWGVDSRIPLVIVLLLVGSSQPVFGGRAWDRLVEIMLIGLLIFRSVIFSYDWYASSRILEEFRIAFHKLPANSVLFDASEAPLPSFQDIKLGLWHPPLPHAAALAAWDGRVFVPQIYAEHGQQPITITSHYAALYRLQNHGPTEVSSAGALDSVVTRIHEVLQGARWTGPVFLLLLYPERLNLPIPERASVVASGTHFLLIALDAPSAAAYGFQSLADSVRN